MQCAVVTKPMFLLYSTGMILLIKMMIIILDLDVLNVPSVLPVRS